MYKYKNVSDFRQSLVIQGKRVLLKPEDVIESEIELRSVFLEAVENSTPTSKVSAGSVTKRVDDLQERLDGLEKEKTAIAENTTQEVYDTISELDRAVKGLEGRFTDLRGIVDLINKKIDSVLTQTQSAQTASADDKKLFTKRLEMLKSAVMTIEEEVFGPSEETQGK
jgi:archaellum component FlaC